MPVCQHCHKQWTYKDSLKKVFRVKKQCPYCRKTNFLSAKSRRRESFLSMLPVFIVWLPMVLMDISLKWLVAAAFVVLLIYYAVLPLFTEITKEEQSLW